MEQDSSQSAKVCIAKIGRPRGIRGEVFLHQYFDLKTESLNGKEIQVHFPDGRILDTIIDKLWWHNKKAICHLKGISSMNEARELVHGEIVIERDQLNPLSGNEYYVEDLIGLEVLTVSNEALGRIMGFMESGASVLLKVNEEKEYLIPFVKEIVVEVAWEEEKIIIDPPPGLLEINED